MEPSLPLLGTVYDTQQTGANNCELLYPPDDPNYIPRPKINIALYVTTPRREHALAVTFGDERIAARQCAELLTLYRLRIPRVLADTLVF